MLMESQVKFRSQQNIPGTSQKKTLKDLILKYGIKKYFQKVPETSHVRQGFASCEEHSFFSFFFFFFFLLKTWFLSLFVIL